MVRLKGFEKLTKPSEALQIWFSRIINPACREILIPLDCALNRVLAEDLIVEEDLPRFDRSAVDGYAIRWDDTIGASQFKPVFLQIADCQEVQSNEARRIWTGNPIPPGANAVVMMENTKRRGSELEVWIPLTRDENVSKRGEDVRKGDIAIKARTRLKPYHLGMLSALGNAEVKVLEQPKIGILATGTELMPIGKALQHSQIFESNRVMISAMCRELGGTPIDLGIVDDDATAIAEKIKTGLENGDAIITTGGTSVGGLDLVPEVVNNMGKPGVIVHGVALRPAMPTALAVLDGKPLIILSGNPVAAIIGFEVFARPLIFRMLGLEKEDKRSTVNAIMTRKVATALGRKTFVRVRVFQQNGDFLAEPVSARGSGAISTMTRGNGFVIVPENREGLAEGEEVVVQLFGDLN